MFNILPCIKWKGDWYQQQWIFFTCPPDIKLIRNIKLWMVLMKSRRPFLWNRMMINALHKSLVGIMYTDIFFCCHMHRLVLLHRTQANFILSFLTLLFTSLNFYGWLFLCLWPCVVRWVLYLLIYNAIPSISCSSVMDTQNNTMRSCHTLPLAIRIQCFSSPKKHRSRGLLLQSWQSHSSQGIYGIT